MNKEASVLSLYVKYYSEVLNLKQTSVSDSLYKSKFILL